MAVIRRRKRKPKTAVTQKNKQGVVTNVNVLVQNKKTQQRPKTDLGRENLRKVEEANKQLQDKINYLNVAGRSPPVGIYQTSVSRDIADLKDAIGLYRNIGLNRTTNPQNQPVRESNGLMAGSVASPPPSFMLLNTPPRSDQFSRQLSNGSESSRSEIIEYGGGQRRPTETPQPTSASRAGLSGILSRFGRRTDTEARSVSETINPLTASAQRGESQASPRSGGDGEPANPLTERARATPEAMGDTPVERRLRRQIVANRVINPATNQPWLMGQIRRVQGEGALRTIRDRG